VRHIHRFFVEDNLEPGRGFTLGEDDSFHAARVLRLRPGQGVELAGGDGRVFDAVVVSVDGPVEVNTKEQIGSKVSAGMPPVTVAQAIPTGKKMDLIVEKLSELGVAALVPLYTEKSRIAPGKKDARGDRPGKDGHGAGGRLERWRRIARAAAGQSRRDSVMEVAEPVAFARWLSSFGSGKLVALATEVDNAPLSDVLKALMSGASGGLTLVIGPESGFSGDELALLREHEAVFAGMGPRILRTETAAIAAAVLAVDSLGGLG
jgi:16S rRNA (uracil1498-N3)-methyltransferase